MQPYKQKAEPPGSASEAKKLRRRWQELLAGVTQVFEWCKEVTGVYLLNNLDLSNHISLEGVSQNKALPPAAFLDCHIIRCINPPSSAGEAATEQIQEPRQTKKTIHKTRWKESFLSYEILSKKRCFSLSTTIWNKDTKFRYQTPKKLPKTPFFHPPSLATRNKRRKDPISSRASDSELFGFSPRRSKDWRDVSWVQWPGK